MYAHREVWNATRARWEFDRILHYVAENGPLDVQSQCQVNAYAAPDDKVGLPVSL